MSGAELRAAQARIVAWYAGVWRHVRTGNLYAVTGAATLCCDAPGLDDQIALLYERADVQDAPRFCRPEAEFRERFERVGGGS